MSVSTRHRDVRTEIDIRRHLGVELGLSALHEVAELFPVVFRSNREIVFCDIRHLHCHGLVARYGGGSREVVGKGERVCIQRIVVSARELLCPGQADGLAAVSVAHGLHLAVESELHLVHLFRDLGGGLRNGVRSEHLSPHGFLAHALQ